MLCGGVFGFAAMPAAALAWLAPMTLGMALSIALNASGRVEWLAAPLLFGYASVLLFGAASHARSFAESVVARARAELAARHDPLTGLPNRTAFDAALAEGLLRCERFGERVSLFSIDFDHFKAVNDLWGHQAGDQLLRQAADRLRDAVGERGFIARLGGDEFSVIVASLVTLSEVETFASDIATCFDAPFLLDAGSTLCRASVGFATAPMDGADAEGLIGAADASLYRAKYDSRDVLPRRPGGEVIAALHRRELTGDMRCALARGEFYLCYQPVVTLRSQTLHGFEALARWRHPRFGEIPPALFIEIAEKNGFIHELGEWILHEACREAAGWPSPISIGVNVSGKQLCDAAFEGHFERALAASGLPANRLQIEVTEFCFARRPERGGTRAASDAGARGGDRARRFRGGLLVVRVDPPVADRAPQDRPRLCRRPAGGARGSRRGRVRWCVSPDRSVSP